MARAGRKRHALAAREPHGKPQRPPHVNDPEYGPTQVKRLLDASMRGLREPEWGSNLGRLFLTHKVDAQQYAAAKRWREMAQKYHHALGIFPVKSAALERGSHAHPPDPDSPDGKRQAKREREQLEQFIRAHAILVSTLAETIVRELCERDQLPVGAAQTKTLKLGLSALAKHWNIDR